MSILQMMQNFNKLPTYMQFTGDVEKLEQSSTNVMMDDIQMSSTKSVTEENLQIISLSNELDNNTNALNQTNQNDEKMLTGLMNKILSSHTEYLKKYGKSRFKPNEARLETIERVKDKMNEIKKKKNLNPKEKMQLVVGLLEANKDIVLHHQKNTDLLAKYGMRGIKKTSRLASIYKKILDKSPEEYGIDVGKAVKKFNTKYPEESAVMVIKNKPSK